MNNIYTSHISIPVRRIRKHSKVKHYQTSSELGNKVLNCPVGASFEIANDSERTNTPTWAKKFGMKFTVRNTPHDRYKQAFRIA